MSEDPDKKKFDEGPGKIWNDDKDFKKLADTPGVICFRLSWFCASDYHSECDKTITYSFKKFSHQEFNATTGETKDVWEDFVWDYNHHSVQLSLGEIQTPFNTPSGSKCECHCHRLAKYKEMVEGKTTPSPKVIGRMAVSQYNQKDLAPEIAEDLK